MASVKPTSRFQSKTRSLHNLAEHRHRYFVERILPRRTELYMRLLFEAEDELSEFEHNEILATQTVSYAGKRCAIDNV